MPNLKHLLIPTLATSLFVLAGCTQTKPITTTNETSNDNVEVAANTNNDNTNTEDWLIYTNEEYGFNFRYPSNWKISKDIFKEYKKSFDNPKYQVDEKDVVFLTSLTADEINSEIYAYQNQTDEMGQGVVESIGKGKLVVIAVSDMTVADLVSQPGFTFTVGDNISLTSGIEATNVYLEKRWEGNSDYHYVYIPFQTTKKTNMDKQVKSIVVYAEKNVGDYDQETLLNIAKTFQENF